MAKYNSNEYVLETLASMTKRDLSLFLIKEDGVLTKKGLTLLTDNVRTTSEIITYLKRLAGKAAKAYNETHSDEDLEQLELYTAAIKYFEQDKRELWQEVKTTGERVRWLRKEYQKKKGSKITDSNKPSSLSEN